jgi:hypothetical protein
MICEKHNKYIRVGECKLCRREQLKQNIDILTTESNILAFEIHSLELENKKIEKTIRY